MREDGGDDDYNPYDTSPSRADNFEYVVYGKVYRIEGDEALLDTGSKLLVNQFARGPGNGGNGFGFSMRFVLIV